MKLRLFVRWILVLAFLLGTLQNVAAQGSKNNPGPAAAGGAESKYRGGVVSPPLPKPKFTLTDTSGAPFDFSAKTQGYVTLLFFGYTHCPDMCPLQMSTLAQAYRKLPPVIADRFKVVFVTTDPARDTPQVLRSWLDHFDKRFIGLTGSQAAIDAAQVAADMAPAKKSTVRTDGNYEVGHALFVFAYTKDDLAHVIYPGGVQEEDWTHDLPFLPSETWASR
ncbi:MAG TPA: SCO family protein [Candidatus Acidoferrales bacterium]|jgi:protein SCO1/2|nr:SCO family protein [Candidatus Acidoferrales bacterium]